jgi:hypothetical protein
MNLYRIVLSGDHSDTHIIKVAAENTDEALALADAAYFEETGSDQQTWIQSCDVAGTSEAKAGVLSCVREI